MTTEEGPEQSCWCLTCRPVGCEWGGDLSDIRMVLCPDCGNKRCPRANDHRNACTNSNATGQPGSAYGREIGIVVTLTGITKKGKQRVRDFGPCWRVLRHEDRVLFNPEIGPWLLITPLGRVAEDNAARWVRANCDADFVVLPNVLAKAVPAAEEKR